VIEDLKPYPETKDSGLAWLGEIQAHWEVKRGKSYLKAIDRRSESGEAELLRKLWITPTIHGEMEA
jgi:type I restriction enzyme S subunit